MAQNAWKTTISKKWKQSLEISSFYTVPVTMACDRCNFCFYYWAILFPFTSPPLPPSFNSPKNKKKTWKYHFTQLHQKSWSQAILFLTCLWFWAIFCPITPITAQKIKIKRKNEKKTWKYHHFIQLYQKSWSHAVLFLTYDTWQDVIVIFHFGLFLPFYPHNSLKNQNLNKKWRKKKRLEISSFYTIVPKIMIICYTVPEIWHVTHVIVIFHFGLFFALLTP